jgi:trk system potassium uptake protein TrkA
MRILILGAGQVGTTVARQLAREDSQITLVDRDPEALARAARALPIQTVLGHCAHPEVLKQAGIEDADLVLAVTDSDETNMLASQIAYSLYHTPTRLARVRGLDYTRHSELFAPGAVPIDHLINPEALVTRFIERLIRRPGSLQILDFAGGRVQLAVVRADARSPMSGRLLRNTVARFGRARARVIALVRDELLLMPGEGTVVEPGDEVYLLASARDLPDTIARFHRDDRPNRRVMIAGGGHIGLELARTLERRHRVKVIERDLGRCRQLAQQLERTIVLHGDAADVALLREEDVHRTDVFCALTGDDDSNLIAALLARNLGVRKSLCIVNRPSSVGLARSGAVDIVINPAEITLGALLGYVRQGDIVAAHPLRNGAAEALELVARGDAPNSRLVGRRIGAIAWPPGARVAAIVRGDQVILCDEHTTICTDDHLVVFLGDRREVHALEKLFEVGLGFFDA